MTASPSEEALEPLRCQQTLGPLSLNGDALVSRDSEHRYPISDGLVFMGYPAAEHDFVQLAMEEERVWQGTTATVARDLTFLRQSAPTAVDLINRVGEAVGQVAGKRALDLGSGSGWGAWLLAEAGYDTWMCDFEANSLALGLLYEHPRLGLGKRIVVDGRYAPFADSSFDLVLCKEFAHHIDDKPALLAEVNRVLKPGGILAFQEPVMSGYQALKLLRHPDTHVAHSISWPGHYLRSMRRRGFEVERYGYHYGGGGRSALTSWIRRRADREVEGPGRRPGVITSAHVHAFGGADLLVIARKVAQADPLPRPQMRLIPPDRIQVGDSDRQAFAPLAEALQEAAQRLTRSA